MASKTYTKVISSNPELLPEVEEFIINIAKEKGLGEDQITILSLSSAEAAANSILHGNKSDETKSVTISVYTDDKLFKVSFKDQGEGFDPNAVPDPTAPENILKDHGRGLHIMKSYLNNLEYNFTDEGTEAILTLEL